MSAPCKMTLLVPTVQSECSGPTILGKRQTNEPFRSEVGLTFLGLGLGFGRGFVVVVTGLVVVVEPGIVVDVEGTVVVVVRAVVVVTGLVVVVVVVLVGRGTNFTGR